MTQPPFAGLKEGIRAELMRTWREGCRDGFEMAARMTEGLAAHEELSEAQRAVLGGLIAALREAGKQAESGELGMSQ